MSKPTQTKSNILITDKAKCRPKCVKPDWVRVGHSIMLIHDKDEQL